MSKLASRKNILAGSALLASALLLAMGAMPAAQAATYSKTFPMYHKHYGFTWEANGGPGGIIFTAQDNVSVTKGNVYYGTAAKSYCFAQVRDDYKIDGVNNRIQLKFSEPSIAYLWGCIFPYKANAVAYTVAVDGVVKFKDTIRCPPSNQYVTLPYTIPAGAHNVSIKMATEYIYGWSCTSGGGVYLNQLGY